MINSTSSKYVIPILSVEKSNFTPIISNHKDIAVGTVINTKDEKNIPIKFDFIQLLSSTMSPVYKGQITYNGQTSSVILKVIYLNEYDPIKYKKLFEIFNYKANGERSLKYIIDIISLNMGILIMHEYNNGDLDKYMNSKKMKYEEINELQIAINNIIQKLRDAKILYLDFKPQNILVNRNYINNILELAILDIDPDTVFICEINKYDLIACNSNNIHENIINIINFNYEICCKFIVNYMILIYRKSILNIIYNFDEYINFDNIVDTITNLLLISNINNLLNKVGQFSITTVNFYNYLFSIFNFFIINNDRNTITEEYIKYALTTKPIYIVLYENEYLIFCSIVGILMANYTQLNKTNNDLSTSFKSYYNIIFEIYKFKNLSLLDNLLREVCTFFSILGKHDNTTLLNSIIDKFKNKISLHKELNRISGHNPIYYFIQPGQPVYLRQTHAQAPAQPGHYLPALPPGPAQAQPGHYLQSAPGVPAQALSPPGPAQAQPGHYLPAQPGHYLPVLTPAPGVPAQALSPPGPGVPVQVQSPAQYQVNYFPAPGVPVQYRQVNYFPTPVQQQQVQTFTNPYYLNLKNETILIPLIKNLYGYFRENIQTIDKIKHEIKKEKYTLNEFIEGIYNKSLCFVKQIDISDIDSLSSDNLKSPSSEKLKEYIEQWDLLYEALINNYLLYNSSQYHKFLIKPISIYIDKSKQLYIITEYSENCCDKNIILIDKILYLITNPNISSDKYTEYYELLKIIISKMCYCIWKLNEEFKIIHHDPNINNFKIELIKLDSGDYELFIKIFNFRKCSKLGIGINLYYNDKTELYCFNHNIYNSIQIFVNSLLYEINKLNKLDSYLDVMKRLFTDLFEIVDDNFIGTIIKTRTINGKITEESLHLNTCNLSNQIKKFIINDDIKFNRIIIKQPIIDDINKPDIIMRFIDNTKTNTIRNFIDDYWPFKKYIKYKKKYMLLKNNFI